MPKKDKYPVAQNWPFVIVGCLVVKGKKVLLIKEARTEAGKWNQPAGWLEKYENPLAGAKRETEEETGLKIKITRFLGVYSIDRRSVKGWHKTRLMDLHAVKLLFLAKVIGKGKRPDPREIAETRWFSLSEVKNLRRQRILRDPDIIDEVQDYFFGEGYPHKSIHHSKFV